MKRPTNQDAIMLDQARQIFIVADGMGGHKGGDIASQMATELFSSLFEKYKEKAKNTPEALRKTIEDINQQIYDKGQQNPHLKGMGTTITALVIEGNKATIANVGDSRCYVFNNRELYQLTKDHTLVQEKINLGICRREDQAAQDKLNNVLVQTVGYETEIKVDIFHYKIHQNDLFLLCSDGLYNKVAATEMVDTVEQFLPKHAQSPDLENVSKKLIALANEYGGQDNISIVTALAV